MTGILSVLIGQIYGGSTPVISDPYFEYTTLLLPGNGTNGAQNNTFLDGSTNNFTITRNGNTTQGTFSPFSQTGWSGSFNTSTTYLTVTDTSNLRFGSSNFTIEAFVYRAASGATQTIASKGASTPTGWVFQISSADKLVFTDTSTSITGATSLAANTWYYVAVVRAGTGSNQTTLYVNAVSDATGTSATTFSQTDNMKIGADRSNTNFANGYISNLRLSNTNRTISSTPTSALTADSNTIFLGLYNNRFQYTDSTAAFTNMSVTGTPSVQAFSPFNPTASWSAATYGGSGYFDGNTDYLTAASSASFDVWGGNFTWECFFYPTGNLSNSLLFAWGTTSGTYISVGFFNNINIYSTVSGTNPISGTAPILNAWNHIAISKSGSTFALFVNGIRLGTSTSTSYPTGNQPVILGSNNSGGQSISGYVTDTRLVKGTAVYDPTVSTLTVPTAPLTAITNTSLLLNFTNAGIYDATSKNDLETVGNAQISTTQSKWGGSSMSFDGTGDYLQAPIDANPYYNFGTGDFTVECWFYANSLSATDYAALLGCNNSGAGNNEWGAYVRSNGIFFYGSSGTLTGVAGTINTSTWYHYAASRSGNTLRIFLNGTQTTSATVTGSYTNSAVGLRVGDDPVGSNPAFNGYLQDVRITKGYARYVTGTGANAGQMVFNGTNTLALPTSAFPTL